MSSDRRRRVAGRAGERASGPIFDLAAIAANRFELSDVEAWHSEFMLGYLIRHALWGMNEVQHRAWRWDRIDVLDFERSLPVACDVVMKNAPSRLPVHPARLEQSFAAIIRAFDPEYRRDSEFGRGVWTGDRLLSGALALSYSEDTIGAPIARAFNRYKQLPGRRPRTIHYLFRQYKWTYAYAVAKTVGSSEFRRSFDDRDAARRLGFGL